MRNMLRIEKDKYHSPAALFAAWHQLELQLDLTKQDLHQPAVEAGQEGVLWWVVAARVVAARVGEAQEGAEGPVDPPWMLR